MGFDGGRLELKKRTEGRREEKVEMGTWYIGERLEINAPEGFW